LRPGVARPLLPVHRGDRPALRRGPHARLPRRAGRQARDGGAAMRVFPFRGGGYPFVIACALLALTGCRQDMAQQPRYDPLEESAFFPDGMSAGPLTPGTVARGHLRAAPHLYDGGTGLEGPSRAAAGLAGGSLAVAALHRHVEAFPFEMTKEVLER